MSLATTDPTVCPDCGRSLDDVEWHEPALFFHGGYGATRSTLVAICECGYELTRRVGETRP